MERDDMQNEVALSGPPEVVAFRPMAAIEWPSMCVGCMESNPSERLDLNVTAVTKADTGGKWGGAAGSIIGLVAGAATGETTGYRVPICRACFSNLPKRERKALAHCEIRYITALPRVETRVLSREFRSRYVVLSFVNARYADAFRSVNKGLVFDSVEAAQNLNGVGSAQAQNQVPTKAEEPTKTACQRCGQDVLKSDWVCPHCGLTNWGAIGCFSVVPIALVALGIFACNPGFWRWCWIAVGALLLLLPATETLRSVTWSKKDEASKEDTKKD